MAIEPILTSVELAALADVWDELAGDVPFRRHAWLGSWWNHYGSGHQLRVLLVRDEQGVPIGLAPWYLAQCSAEGRVLRMLGSGEACTDYLSLPCAAGAGEQVVAELADWLTAAAASSDELRWDALHLDGIDASDLVTARLVEQMWERGHGIHRRTGVNCWRLQLPADWEAYLEMLSKSHRKQLRRFERRVFEPGRARLERAENREQLAAGMEILVELHQRRRTSLGEPGRFAAGPFGGFLHEAAGRLLEEDRLRLGWLLLDERPVAAEFQVAGGGVVYAYQAGIDPDVAEEEPGSLINIATIQAALAAGAREFDFLRGDEPYKAHWRASPRESMDLRIVPNRASARIRHGVWLAAGNVKNWIRSGLDLTGMR